MNDSARYYLQQAQSTTGQARQTNYVLAFECMCGDDRADYARRAMETGLGLPVCPICLAETVAENQYQPGTHRLVVFCRQDPQHYSVNPKPGSICEAEGCHEIAVSDGMCYDHIPLLFPPEDCRCFLPHHSCSVCDTAREACVS